MPLGDITIANRVKTTKEINNEKIVAVYLLPLRIGVRGK